MIILVTQFLKKFLLTGKNNSEQHFLINEEKFKYSLYPVVLENLNGKKEHIMSLIYVVSNKLLR